MGLIQKILIALVILILAAATALTWGSLGSVLTGFGLILALSALLWRWMERRQDPDNIDWGE